MSLCPSQEDEKETFKGDREHDIRTEMRGTIRTALLPLAMFSEYDLFAPIDMALGIDKRKILLEELESFKGVLNLTLEDVKNGSVGQERTDTE